MQQTHMASNSDHQSKQDVLLSVRNLKTHFPLDEGTVVAVDGTSFDLNAGKTLGIVGESGCGKSVTARSILGILDRPGRIVDGEILWHPDPGNDMDDAVDLAQLRPNGKQIRSIRGKEIAYIFQEPMTSFSPVHTVGNQLVEVIRLHLEVSKKDAWQMGIDMLRRVGIPSPEQRINAYSFELSGGLRQRAMIAMALATSPRLLIADEPTGNVDPEMGERLMRLILEMNRRLSTTVMIATHDKTLVDRLGAPILRLENGMLMHDRKPGFQ